MKLSKIILLSLVLYLFSSGIFSFAAPPVPANFKVEVSGSSFKLTWSNVLSAKGYYLYYSTWPGVTSAQYIKKLYLTKSIVGASAPYYLLSGLDPDLTYYFVLTSYDGSVESGYTSEISGKLTLLAPSALSAKPRNLSNKLVWGGSNWSG